MATRRDNLLVELVRRLGLTLDSMRKWTKVISVTAIAAILGVLVNAGFNFYRDVWKPAHEPERLVLSTALEYAGSRADMVAYQVPITARNVSNKRAHIIGSYINVFGLRMIPSQAGSPTPSPGAEPTPQALRPNEPKVNTPHFSIEGSTNIYSKNNVLADEWLDSEEEVSTSIVIYVPQDTYDGISLDFNVDIANIRGEICAQWMVTGTGDVFPMFYLRPADYPAARWMRDCPDDAGLGTPIDGSDPGQVEATTRKFGFSRSMSHQELSTWRAGFGQAMNSSAPARR